MIPGNFYSYANCGNFLVFDDEDDEDLDEEEVVEDDVDELPAGQLCDCVPNDDLSYVFMMQQLDTNYGRGGCAAWDDGDEIFGCGDNVEDYCTGLWCYVDESCAAADVTASKVIEGNFYSYLNCGNEIDFLGDDDDVVDGDDEEVDEDEEVGTLSSEDEDVGNNDPYSEDEEVDADDDVEDPLDEDDDDA